MEGKEKRVEEKEVEKKGKGKKWFWEKSFLFLFDCVFASSLLSLHSPHHHATTYVHTHPPHNIQHNTLVHTITRKQGRVLCCLFFWEWTARHTQHHLPHTQSHDIMQHTNEPNTDTAHGISNKKMTTANED